MFSWTSSDFHFLEPIQVNFQFLSHLSPFFLSVLCLLDPTRCCVSNHSEATAVVAQHFLYCCTVTACSMYPAWKKQQSLKSVYPMGIKLMTIGFDFVT